MNTIVIIVIIIIVIDNYGSFWFLIYTGQSINFSRFTKKMTDRWNYSIPKNRVEVLKVKYTIE